MSETHKTIINYTVRCTACKHVFCKITFDTTEKLVCPKCKEVYAKTSKGEWYPERMIGWVEERVKSNPNN